MSYDLMVFDPKAPPPDRSGFMNWYDQQTKWAEGHDYDDPSVSTPALRAWFHDMITNFPAMNGPYASQEIDDSRVTDYSIGKFAIYTGFAWSQADEARKIMFKLAEKHGVGFFDVSENNGGVWIPTSGGQYSCIHGRGAQKASWWSRFFGR